MTDTPADHPSSVVVVGGGLAAARTAEELRDRGYAGPVTLLGAEAELPYSRPPLSKGFLQGESEFQEQLVQDEDWYAEHDVDLRRGVQVTAIHPQDHAVELSDGSRVSYGVLVIATGAEPVRPPITGVESALVLRTRSDSETIRGRFGAGRRLVVVGGGWIGLEVAAAARLAGSDVVLLESAEQPLLGVLGAEVGGIFADLHRAHGVDLRTGVEVASITGHGVTLQDGTTVEAETVVLGTGVEPRARLAETAGLAVADGGGILVDASLRTSDPDVWAVGDVADHDHPTLGRLRVEHWTNANFQPEAAVGAILGGDDVYDRLPKFTSAQFDLSMEYVGHVADPASATVITRGDVASLDFATFWLAGDGDADGDGAGGAGPKVLAVMVVNEYADLDEVRGLIERGDPVDPAKLADPTVDYADVTA